MLWYLKSPASRLFTQPFIEAQIKENIKAPIHWPLWGEFTADQGIPRTKGQLRGSFHLMTSSYIFEVVSQIICLARCLQSIMNYTKLKHVARTNSICFPPWLSALVMYWDIILQEHPSAISHRANIPSLETFASCIYCWIVFIWIYWYQLLFLWVQNHIMLTV